MNILRHACSQHHKTLAKASLSRRFLSSKALIINAVGSDRLGIVSDMTKYVTDVGGNVGESQASKLGTYFSLMMLVDVPENKVDNLVDNLQQMQDMNATVHAVSKSPAVSEKSRVGYSGHFTLEGADNPGIVHNVTSILARNGLSIEKLETSDDIAPHGGTTLFRMQGVAHAYEPLTARFSVDRVREELEAMADHLNCDIELIDLASNPETTPYVA